MTDPDSFATAESPIVVIGGSLAGIAVAARLAYRGHHVVLAERGDALGGHWVRTGLPPVIDLPAVWRDLFTKSGRALDPVLATQGIEWTPAAPVLHRFSDGSDLVWPTGRGDQLRTATRVWGRPVAERWRDLVDALNKVWLTLRPLGLERDTSAASWRAASTGLTPPGYAGNATVADLAASLQHPQAVDLVNQVAWQRGQDPTRAPAFLAFPLATERTFGRWQLGTADAPVPSTVLLELLTQRLTQRQVDVRLGTTVEQVDPGPRHRGAARADVTRHTVQTSAGTITARAVIAAVTPHRWAAISTPSRWRPVDRAQRRVLHQAWARAPQVITSGAPSATESPAGDQTGTAVGDHSAVVDHRQHTVHWPGQSSGTASSTWSWAEARPDASAGAAWTSLRTWQRLPGPRIGAHYTAGPHTRAGAGMSGELLSAALAAYAVHADLTGEDIHPSNRNQPPRPRRRPGR